MVRSSIVYIWVCCRRPFQNINQESIQREIITPSSQQNSITGDKENSTPNVDGSRKLDDFSQKEMTSTVTIPKTNPITLRNARSGKRNLKRKYPLGVEFDSCFPPFQNAIIQMLFYCKEYDTILVHTVSIRF